MQINILLCDDEAIQRAAMRVALTRLEGLPFEIASIREAGQGREALDMIAASQPHVLFLDLRMPVLGGLETAEIIRERYPELAIIILTAYDEFHFAQEALKLGAKDYLLKPATAAEIGQVLTKTVQELMIRAERARRLAQLQQLVEESKPYIQLEYIDDLLGLARLTKTALDEKRDFLELPRHPELVMLLELDDFANATKADSEELRQARKEEVRSIIRQEMTPYDPLFARMGGDRFCLLLATPQSGRGDAECAARATALAEQLRQRINRDTGLKLTIGIGRRYHDPRDLKYSLQQAQLAVSHKFILGGNHSIHIDDVELNQTDNSSVLQQLEEEVKAGLRLGDRKSFDALFYQLIDQLCQQGLASFDSARWRFLQLLVTLSRAALAGGAVNDELTACNLGYVRRLHDAKTLAELRELIFAAGEELIELVSRVRSLRHFALVERAQEYLENNYMQPLSLTEVAAVVHLSPFYFSHVFKEQTGMSYIEYVTYLRINEAKRLLSTQSDPVSSVAARVGYKDVNYFARVFRREAGLTPTQYRQSTK